MKMRTSAGAEVTAGFMLTFKQIFDFLPQEQKRLTLSDKLLISEVIALVIAFSLAFYAQNYGSGLTFRLALASLALGILLFLMYLMIEMRSIWRMFAKPTEGILGRLDTKLSEEKIVSQKLTSFDEFDLKSMHSRVDAEILAVERWVDAIKPLAVLSPAVLVIVSSDLLAMPKSLASTFQLFCAAFIVGTTIAAVSLGAALVKLRRISWMLNYTLEVRKKNINLPIRKVSRKRHHPLTS